MNNFVKFENSYINTASVRRIYQTGNTITLEYIDRDQATVVFKTIDEANLFMAQVIDDPRDVGL